MLRRIAVLALLLSALSLSLGTRSLRADPVSTQQLAGAVLSPDDLANFAITRDTTPDNGEVYDVSFERLLSSTAPMQSGYAMVDVKVQVLSYAVPSQLVVAYLTNGKLFNGFSKQVNFQHTGPLGVGIADDSMYFETALPNSTATYDLYVDVFMRGRMVVTLRYGAVKSLDDPSLLVQYATLQDNKLQSSAALPPALLNPLASTRELASHRWYTDSAPDAALYYCDDDPGWRALSLDSLDSYGTVADLLAQYPNRRLHQPCADGATGP